MYHLYHRHLSILIRSDARLSAWYVRTRSEPNTQTFWPLGICNLTQCLPDTRFKELWRRAVTILRTSDATAIIVGPSVDGWDFGYLSTFLLWAKAQEVLPDIICWHELTPGANGSEIPEHHRQMRAWLAANGINASIPIAHNEFVPATAQLHPAETLGAIAGMELAGAIGGTHSQFSDPGCAHPTCAGFFTCDDSFTPRSVWWVFERYARSCRWKSRKANAIANA